MVGLKPFLWFSLLHDHNLSEMRPSQFLSCPQMNFCKKANLISTTHIKKSYTVLWDFECTRPWENVVSLSHRSLTMRDSASLNSSKKVHYSTAITGFLSKWYFNHSVLSWSGVSKLVWWWLVRNDWGLTTNMTKKLRVKWYEGDDAFANILMCTCSLHTYFHCQSVLILDSTETNQA